MKSTSPDWKREPAGCGRGSTWGHWAKYIIAAFLLMLASSAFGLSIEIPVTPDTLNQRDCIFSISNNAVQNEVRFHVTITATVDNSSPEISAWLGTKRGENLDSPTRVTLKRDGHMWEADFTASKTALKNPDLYFVFEMVPDVKDKNGNRVPITSAVMFEMKLKEFLKQ